MVLFDIMPHTSAPISGLLITTTLDLAPFPVYYHFFRRTLLFATLSSPLTCLVVTAVKLQATQCLGCVRRPVSVC